MKGPVLFTGRDSDIRDLTMSMLGNGDWINRSRSHFSEAASFARCVRYWQQQRIMPSIARIVGGLDVPPHCGEWAARVLRDNGLRALHHIHCLASVTRLLDEIDLPVMPIKGVVLATLLHQDPGSRHCGDIDVLVPAHRFDEAVTHLMHSGYRLRDPKLMSADERFRPILKRCKNDLGLIGPDGRHVIELHHRLCKYPGFFPDDYETLRADAQPVQLGGTTWFTVGRRDLVAYLAFHAMISRWGAMKWFLDVAEASRLLGAAGVEDAYERAGRGGFLPLLDAALVLAARLLEQPEPTPQGGKVRHHRLVNAVWQRLADGSYAVENRRDPLRMVAYRLGLVTGMKARYRVAEVSALQLLL
jgi:hypothetical protein